MASPYLDLETTIVAMARSLQWLPADALDVPEFRAMSYDLLADVPPHVASEHDAEALRRERMRRKIFTRDARTEKVTA